MPGSQTDFAFDKGLVPPNGRRRQQCHQATSERQITVAPLRLIAVQSRNPMAAHPGSGLALQFPSAVGFKNEPNRGSARQRSAEQVRRPLWRGCRLEYSVLAIE